MKALLYLIISGALVVSGYSQTRNVLVGTNNAVVQPTNFWSADASNARTGLGLGTAATNPASAFQPSSSVLSNLAIGNGADLTNISATIVGTNVSITNVAGLQSALDGKLATNGDGSGVTNISGANIVGAVASASNITGTIAISNVSNLQSSLDGKLGTNPTLAIANISNLQTTLDGKLGTNPTLQISNIAALQTALDGKLSGTFPIAISNVSGLQTSLDGKLGTNPTLSISNISGLQTNLDSKLSLTGNAINLTNFPTVALASNITGTAALASNVTGVVAIANGGTGVTNAEQLKSALGVGSNDVFVGLSNLGVSSNLGFASTPYILGSTNSTAPNNAVLALNGAGVRSVAGLTLAALTNTDNVAFRTAIGLGTAATNPATAFQTSSANLTNLAANNGTSLTNIPVAGVVGALPTNGDAIALTNFPALLLRTNGNGAGLTNLTAANITGTVGLASNVTGTIAISNGGSGATTAGGARTNLGLGFTALTNTNIDLFKSAIELGETDIVTFSELILRSGTNSSDIHFALDSTEMGLGVPIVFGFTNQTLNAAISRTNLGLVWSALTNTNASGFQASLFGANTNPVLVNTNGEVVSPTNFWQVAPIATLLQNSTPVVNATNAATNARLLFLFSLAPSTVGVTNTITLPTNGGTFNGDVATITHSGPTNSVTAVRQLGASTNIITLNQVDESVRFLYRNNQWTLMDNISYIEPIYFSGTNAAANVAASRTNLGLGATWLTNTDVTNFRTAIGLGTTNSVSFLTIDADAYEARGALIGSNGISFEDGGQNITRTNLGLPLAALTNTSVTNFQKAIFYTNTAPSNVGGNLGTIAAWIEIVASNGVTYKIPAYTNVP